MILCSKPELYYITIVRKQYERAPESIPLHLVLKRIYKTVLEKVCNIKFNRKLYRSNAAVENFEHTYTHAYMYVRVFGSFKVSYNNISV